MHIALQSPVNATPRPTVEVPADVAALPAEFGTLGEMLARVGEFAVTGGRGEPVVPISPAAAAMLATDPDLAGRLLRLADLVRELPSGKVSRISMATEFETFHAARTAAHLHALGTSSAADARRAWVQLGIGAQRFIEGEYLPGTAHMLLGPIGSNGVLHRFGDAPPVDVTSRSAYIVAHEVAHARQPVVTERLADATVRAVEEARADLVVRWTNLAGRASDAVGIPLDPATLDADGTYSSERSSLVQALQSAGLSPGAATGALLDATEASALVGRLGRG